MFSVDNIYHYIPSYRTSLIVAVIKEGGGEPGTAMRVSPVRILKCVLCFVLGASLLAFLTLLRTSADADANKVFFAGPVPMKVVEHYSVDDVKLSDPVMNSVLRTFSCEKLFNNEADEMARAVTFLRANQNFTTRPEAEYEEMTSDCERYRMLRGFINSGVTYEEIDFPIAFNILFHRNVEQLERLLRAIYRPQNQYCIHVDAKTPQQTLNAVRMITKCFPNVFIASHLEIVIYASYTRLTADINCMKDHVKRDSRWKYLLNMAASEFPLLSNLQIVQTLKEFNGANDIREVLKTLDMKRFKQKHFTYIDVRKKTGHMIHSESPKEPPPSNLTITKGNAYNIFSRKFVEFALSNAIARDLLAWSADTFTPDEHYWATLNNLYSNGFLNTPGGYKGHPDQKPYFGRYIGWNTTEHAERCRGRRYVHNICVFGVQDLPAFRDQGQIIANKFDIEYDPIVYKCMEEWIVNATISKIGISEKYANYYRRIAVNSNI